MTANGIPGCGRSECEPRMDRNALLPLRRGRAISRSLDRHSLLRVAPLDGFPATAPAGHARSLESPLQASYRPLLDSPKVVNVLIYSRSEPVPCQPTFRRA